MDFFYDFQIRRYLVMFMRAFSNFKIRTGPDAAGNYAISKVPIIYGDSSWVVSQIIKGASENTMLPNPMFSAYIDNIKRVPSRIQDPTFVGKVSTVERQFNPVTGSYNDQPGVRQDIERYMPVPIDIYFKLDVWTPNTEIKLQLYEQISTIFNPSVQLQQNSNLLDWTSIFELWLDGDPIWTNRSIGQTGDEQRDVMTFKFKAQAWINPPAKLKRSTLITQIVTNIHNVSEIDQIEKMVTDNDYNPFNILSPNPIQIITTLGNYKILVRKGTSSDEIVLLNQYGIEDPTLRWFDLFQKYGQINPEITKILLKQGENIEETDFDIIGFIEQDPTRENVLLYNVDEATIPGSTIAPISEIIDPTEVWPGSGLPAASPGQRYLLTSNKSSGEEPAIPPGVSTSPWGINIVAYPNDIIEYNGGIWKVVFDSRNSTTMTRVVNNSNGTQYSFKDGQWVYTFYGQYAPGYWRIDGIVNAPNGTVINHV